MNSTVNDTNTSNEPCSRIPLSPSKIPVSPNRKVITTSTANDNRHLLHNCSTVRNDDCNLSDEKECTYIDTNNKPTNRLIDTEQHSNQEIECTNTNKQTIYPLSLTSSSSTSSANCCSSQHDSRLKCHQANNPVILRHPHVTNDGHKNHRSLSPPMSHVNSTVTSTTNSLNRMSLQQLSSGKKAIRIKLYRNGDKFFKGIIYPLSTERIRSFDAFLEDLTRILVDQVSLPKGVRSIFTVDGSEKIKSLDKLKAGLSYVVSSTDHFVKLNYENISGVSKFETGIVPSASCISGPGGFAGSITIPHSNVNNNNDDKSFTSSAYGATATVTIRSTDCILDPIVPVTCKIVPCSRSESLPRNIYKQTCNNKASTRVNNTTCQSNTSKHNNGKSNLSMMTKNHAIVSSSINNNNKVKGNNINYRTNNGQLNCVNNATCLITDTKKLSTTTVASNINCKCRPVMCTTNCPCNTSDGRSSSSSCASASSYSNYTCTNNSSKDTGNGSSSSGNSSIASNVKDCHTDKTSHKSNRLTSSLICKQNNGNNINPLSNSYTDASSSSVNVGKCCHASSSAFNRTSRLPPPPPPPVSLNNNNNNSNQSGIKHSASSVTVSQTNAASVRCNHVNRITANSDQHLLLPTAKRGLPGKPVVSRFNCRSVNKTTGKNITPSSQAPSTSLTRGNGRFMPPCTSASTSCVPNKVNRTTTDKQNQSKINGTLNKCRIIPSASTSRMSHVTNNTRMSSVSNRTVSTRVSVSLNDERDKKSLQTTRPKTTASSTTNSTGKSIIRSKAAAAAATSTVGKVTHLKNNTSTSQSKNVTPVTAAVATTTCNPVVKSTTHSNNQHIRQVTSTSSTSCSSTSGNSSESDDDDDDISSPLDSVTPPIETELIRRHTITPDSDLSVLIPKEVVTKYQIGTNIGDGNFAVVYECLNRQNKMPVALKIIDKTKCKGRESMIANEVAILKRISHPNIIRFIDQFDYTDELYLFTELVKGGDLFDAIAEATKYNETDASGMMYDLTSALAYLHSRNICHRDIKPENLLVCDYSPVGRNAKTIKLADFGLAVELPAGGLLFDVCGTPNYVAPEILCETGYDHKVDVWAAGVIAYVLLCGFPPFVSPDNDQVKLFDQILTGYFDFPPESWDGISSSVKCLITDMLNVDQTRRPTPSTVLRHPWIQKGSSFTYTRASSGDLTARHPSR